MMSTKQLACMLALHICYLLVGASIFYHIESPVELAHRAEEKLERLEIQNLLYENYIPDDPDKQDTILRKLSDYCGKSMFNYTTEDEEPPYKWDFYHSFFFSYTVVSTIGYGNLAPTTHLSRILMIFYGLFGIPINGILLANLGEYFGVQLISVYRKYKRRNRKRADNLDYVFHNLGMLGQIFLYLVPGFLFFIFLPACIFVVFEGWDYVASIYYAFVTLTTIGFGDLVAGTINNGFKSGYFFTYQIFLIVWITFGLGYIVMLLGFITSGMRSEGIHKLEQKFTQQFKAAQNRVLQGFTKDLNAVRKIINEANLIQIKPIYVDYSPQLYKSASCPTFTFDVEPRGPIVSRKRANSENIHISAKDMMRIQSDTDLLGIDKEKTFNATAIVKPAELLARVVNVLGGVDQPAQERGVHMFDDDQILASEKPPVFSIGNDVITNSQGRNRALSVAVPNYRKDSMQKPDGVAWANGDSTDKYNEAKIRSGKMSLPTITPIGEEDLPPKSILSKMFHKKQGQDSPTDYINNTMKGRDSDVYDPPIPEPVQYKPKRRGSIFPTFFQSSSAEKTDKTDADAYREKTKRGRGSIFPTFNKSEEEDEDMSKAYKEKTKRGRGSIFPTFDFSEDDDAAAIRAYQKKKRHSIFPTFDFGDDEEEEDMAKTYRNKTKSGRKSIFPTFDFSDPEEDTAKKYKESTKRGRGSIFPTFDFSDRVSDDEDDTIDEEELQRYQKKTQKGRLSLFPTFGKAKKEKHDEESVIPEDSDDDVEKYKSKTRKGRGSLFPTFGKNKNRNNSSSDEPTSDLEASIRQFQKQMGQETSDDNFDADLESYRNKTKRGRGSLFDPHVNLSTLPQDEQVEVLEQTSVADLLRVLAVLDTGSGNEASSSSPASSLLGLLGQAAAPAPNPAATRRRGSIRPADFKLPPMPPIPQFTPKSSNTSHKIDIPPDTSDKPQTKMESSTKPDAEESQGPRRRRVSARSAAAQFTPTLATVVAGSELQITAVASRENRMSMLQHPPPPYTETVEEEAKSQPRVRRYSPAPGDHSRPSTGPVPRLFSRIRKESASSLGALSIEEEEEIPSRRSSLTDIVIDNNKDQT